MNTMRPQISWTAYLLIGRLAVCSLLRVEYRMMSHHREELEQEQEQEQD